MPALSSFQEEGLRSLPSPPQTWEAPFPGFPKWGEGRLKHIPGTLAQQARVTVLSDPTFSLGRDLEARSTWHGLLRRKKPGASGSSPSLWISLHVARAGRFASPGRHPKQE